MRNRILMNGNDAIGEGAIRAGCHAYFGYPITPQNELTAYMAQRMPECGRVFIQAESEVAAINMVYGAVVTGKRAMTSSSSPGISLKQEGLSYLAAAELPAVIVNVQRGGPGLGNIAPSQADYFQATKGGGHGDYRLIVLAPNSVQEMHDFTINAFALADRYRNPVMILTDGRLGQMMEPLALYKGPSPKSPPKPWSLTGARNRKPNHIRSLLLDVDALEERNLILQSKYKAILAELVGFDEYLTRDAQVLTIAYGSSARIAKGAVNQARARGIKAGLLRPITLWPFPRTRIRQLAEKVKGILVVEMSAGQMLEDVQLAVGDRCPVAFEGRMGGAVPEESDILATLRHINKSTRKGTRS
jgi:2-oxoglutarate ferredoxin oxidoreductase subunit alpha